jgi:hypothetical protein
VKYLYALILLLGCTLILGIVVRAVRRGEVRYRFSVARREIDPLSFWCAVGFYMSFCLLGTWGALWIAFANVRL